MSRTNPELVLPSHVLIGLPILQGAVFIGTIILTSDLGQDLVQDYTPHDAVWFVFDEGLGGRKGKLIRMAVLRQKQH